MTTPTILVASATANTGSNAVRQLSATGKVSVRALARNPESAIAQELAKLPNVEVVQGDFGDPASLKAALEDVSRAFLVCSNDNKQANETSFISAAMEAGLEVVVRVSTMNALIDLNTPYLNPLAHARIEKFIEDNKARVIDLQPNFFMSNILRGRPGPDGKFVFPVSDEQAASMPPVAFIDPRDVAGAGVVILLLPQDQLGPLMQARMLEVHGPEEVTFAQLLAALSNASGRQLSFRYSPPEEYINMLVGFGVSRDIAEAYEHTIQVTISAKPGPRPMVQKTSPALAAVWQPKYTISDWAKDFGGPALQQQA